MSASPLRASAQAAAGELTWDEVGRSLTWTGPLAAGAALPVSFRATVAAGAAEGSVLVLEASLTDDAGRRTLRTARATVSLPPQIVRVSPADGAVDVGPTTVVIVTFNEAMDPYSLRLTTDPPLPESAWEAPAWTANGKSATLRHSLPFRSGTRYTLTLSARDPSGLSLAPGPVPNPWGFTVEKAADAVQRLTLPWLGKP